MTEHKSSDDITTNLIFISGTGRSGTTWLAELLNYDDSYRIVFEPFLPDNGSISKDCFSIQYLRPNDSSKKYIESAALNLSGRVHNTWTNRYNHNLDQRNLIVKDIRTNLMLKWFRQQFPYFPIIYIVRHPCAVALSSTKFDWRINPEELFLDQPYLREDYLEPFVPLIKSAQTPFEQCIVSWCVEQYVVFKQLRKMDKILIVNYENLVTRPKKELERIYAYLGRVFSTDAMTNIKKQATTGRTVPYQRYITRRNSLVYDWPKRLTRKQRAFASNAVTAFGLGILYGDDPLPVISADLADASRLPY